MSPYHVPRDPRKPLPGEVSTQRRILFNLVGGGVIVLGVGVMLGLVLAPDTPIESKQRIAVLESELMLTKQRVLELDRAVQYKASSDVVRPTGRLRNEDKKRHERESKRYTKILRQVKAQSAAELVQWFITRWNGLLDQPAANDRTTRRAELLSRLVGGMSENLHPDDYVPWQAEFLNGDWLGELHFDMDGDGYPGKRSGKNPHDGFADVSVCQIAMAMNQAARDARVLVMHDMKCEAPHARMSLFLQGATIDEALDELVRELRRAGFVAVERTDSGMRLVLVAQGARGDSDE
jgi:hypothetical protein